MKNILSTIVTILFALGLGVAAAHAEPALTAEVTTTGADFSADLLNPDDRPSEALTSPFRQAVIGILNYILTFLGLLAVGFIVYAGILMVVDSGSEENVGKAKNIITYAAIGLVIVLLSFAIVQVVVDVKTAVA